MMMRVRLILFILGIFALMSCDDANKAPVSSVSGTGNTAKITRPKTIALVLKTTTNPFFIEMEKGARKAASESGVDLLVKAAGQETAVEQQIQIVDELIKTKIDAIVIAPSDSQRLVPILKKAQEMGIVIINIDNQLDLGVVKAQQLQQIPFVSVDNEKASYQAVKYVVDQIHQPAKAAIIEGIRAAENARARMQGAKRAFSDNGNIQVVAEDTANWKIDEAHEVTKRMFLQHPDIRVLFCANDMMALGALKYLQDSGRKHVLLAGYDALSEAKQAVQNGTMSVTVDQQASEQGYQGVVLALKALNGERLPPLTLVEAHLVTANNLK